MIYKTVLILAYLRTRISCWRRSKVNVLYEIGFGLTGNGFKFIFRRHSFQGLVRAMAIFTQFFCDFPQFLQANFNISYADKLRTPTSLLHNRLLISIDYKRFLR